MPDSSPTRRTVLRTAGLVALTGGGVASLGACSADGGTAAPAPSSAPASSSAGSEAASPSPSAAASESASAKPSAKPSAKAKPPSGPSVATSEVPVGGGVILKDANFVVTQPTKGSYKAFSKICTHKGCPVAEVKGGTIDCKCHGSKFSIKDGSVVNPPASKPLAESDVTVSGGKVYVTG
jgi:Rieske Fe-S protein